MPHTKQRWLLGLGLLGFVVLSSWLARSPARGRVEVDETEQDGGAEAVKEEAPREPADPSLSEPPAPPDGPTASPARVEVALEPEREATPRRTTRFLVRDAQDHRPIAGALVQLFDRATPTTRTTDEEGVALLPELPLPRTARFVVEAGGYCDRHDELVARNSTVVLLERATTLHGRVLAADTLEPVGGARLTILSESDLSEGRRGGESVLSGADGSYALGPVPLRAHASLAIRAEGFAAAVRTFELDGDERRTQQEDRKSVV